MHIFHTFPFWPKGKTYIMIFEHEGKDSRKQIKDIVKNNVNDTHLNKTKKDSITETCYSMKSKISKLLKQQRKFSTQKILSKENFKRILMEL